MPKRNTSTASLDAPDRNSVMAEERFLFDTQVEMQKLLNEKGFKYKDLALGLGVSEARVSQLFSDDNNNLTIRTIARVYHQLGEVPVLLSERALNKRLAEAGGFATSKGGWVVAAEVDEFDIGRGSEFVPKIDEPVSRERRPTGKEWVAAEGQLNARSHAA